MRMMTAYAEISTAYARQLSVKGFVARIPRKSLGTCYNADEMKGRPAACKEARQSLRSAVTVREKAMKGV